MLDKLIVYLNENSIDTGLFAERILMRKSLDSLYNEKQSWDHMRKTTANSFKIIYSWLNDEQRLLKLNIDKKIFENELKEIKSDELKDNNNNDYIEGTNGISNDESDDSLIEIPFDIDID